MARAEICKQQGGKGAFARVDLEVFVDGTVRGQESSRQVEVRIEDAALAGKWLNAVSFGVDLAIEHARFPSGFTGVVTVRLISLDTMVVDTTSALVACVVAQATGAGLGVPEARLPRFDTTLWVIAFPK